MCDPVSIGLAVVGGAASLYGSVQQANAIKAQSATINQQNIATATAQNTAFQQRMQAGLQQTAAQQQASDETMAERNTAFDTMRAGQTTALKSYQDVLAAENSQADTLRQTGDTAAQQLLQATTAQQQQGAQATQQQQAVALLQPGVPQGPQPTDPSGENATSNDPAMQGALARRTAEAATNIRNYGAKIGQLASYDAPNQAVQMAIAANKYGIMPAQAAEALLRGGSATRLLPSQVNYQAATGLGGAADALIQSKGQSALDAAGLTYGNATDIANLQQSNADTIAKNQAQQKIANAQFQQSQGAVISGLGNLGLYGSGYISGVDPSKVAGSVKSSLSSALGFA